MRLRFSLLFLALLLPSICSASHCDKVLANDELINCLGKDYSNIDRRLNQVYNALRGKLSAEKRKSLKESQLAWLASREKQCEEEASQVAGGQAYQPTYIECQISATGSRIKKLRESKW